MKTAAQKPIKLDAFAKSLQEHNCKAHFIPKDHSIAMHNKTLLTIKEGEAYFTMPGSDYLRQCVFANRIVGSFKGNEEDILASIVYKGGDGTVRHMILNKNDDYQMMLQLITCSSRMSYDYYDRIIALQKKTRMPKIGH